MYDIYRSDFMTAVVITGAGSGLGRSLALAYSRDFDEIILLGRSTEKLLETKQLLPDKQVFTYELDIRSQTEIERLTHTLFSRHPVTALINNAGVGHFGPITDMPADQIKEMLDTNVFGTILLTQAFLKHYKEKGKIVNIISTAGLRGKVNESAYCASKFALRGFTESLVKEYEGTGIVLSGAYMGGMDTPFWNESDHIKDKSRLRSPDVIAEKIYSLDDGRSEIIVE